VRVDEWIRPWRLYADFGGRATRRDYWFFHLGAAGVLVAVGTLSRLVEDSLAWLIAALRLGESNAAALLLFAVMLMPLLAVPILLVPSLAVSARRLRDLGRSPRWLLLLAVPFGAVALLALLGLGRGVAAGVATSPPPPVALGADVYELAEHARLPA
jgi:uncharacterized membrane protein YhaH (DUF805 family)